MPILGIVDSSKRVNLDLDSMTAINSFIVDSSGASNVTFSNIPSTYAHLQIRCFVRAVDASVIPSLRLRFNSDSAGNYTSHYSYGQGVSVGTDPFISGSYCWAGAIAGGSTTSGIFASNIIDILDYSDSNKYTTFRSLGGVDLNGSGEIQLTSGLWRQLQVVDSVTFPGFTFAQYSRFELYGVKKA